MGKHKMGNHEMGGDDLGIDRPRNDWTTQAGMAQIRTAAAERGGRCPAPGIMEGAASNLPAAHVRPRRSP
jgi:hypothetical protein